ncbi:hypothetical protein [Clostridium saccharoperbutylacetonicum]|uniref:hypothetical protein n=1 Tax=Clostridium saccharoperbutylacetonicum TaxID=36745 RepID=UPI0039EC0A3D
MPTKILSTLKKVLNSCIKLTAETYMCNMAVCKDKDADDVWYVANNLAEPTAIREYKTTSLLLKKYIFSYFFNILNLIVRKSWC